MKLDKKETNKQLWINEQLDNIDRRMDYVKLKNTRVQKQIDTELGKIAKEQDKYKDYVEELKERLDEAEKDARTAMVLQKTYVDQLEREKAKLIDEQQQNQTDARKLSGDEDGVSSDIKFLIRNNEGKICNKRRGSKAPKNKKKQSNKNVNKN